MRIKIGLKCSDCGDINYTTTKNAKIHSEKFEVSKFCRRTRKYAIHKEVKLKH